MNPILAAGLVTGGANLVGGLLGFGSQQSANENNLQIARENNEANLYMANKAMANQRRMQERQMMYNSPAQQRNMFEDAGYNAAAYLGNAASSGSAPSVSSGNPSVAPHVIPQDAFANALGRVGSDVANTLVAYSAAKKNLAEANKTELESEYTSQMASETLRKVGLEADAIAIKNRWADSKEEFTLEGLKNAALIQEKSLSILEIDRQLKTFYKNEIQPKERDELLQKISVAKSQEELNKALKEAHITQAAAAMIQAQTGRFLAPHQARALDSSAELSATQKGFVNSQKFHQDLENAIYRWFGVTDKKTHTLTNLANLANTEALLFKIWNESDLLKQEIKWYDFKAVAPILLKSMDSFNTTGSVGNGY